MIKPFILAKEECFLGNHIINISMNRTVTATGMKVQATASQSLVISNTIGSTGVGTETSYTFTTSTSQLIPATHDGSGAFTTGLKYNTNPNEVSAGTGLQAGTTALTYADAINDPTNSKYYYVDYVVYIASSGGELTNQKLTAVLSQTTSLDTDTIKATSIDFYVNRDSAALGTFVGTLNIAGLDASTNNATATKDTIDLLSYTSASRTIPVNKNTTTYLQVTMRVYFDGALLKTKSPDQAFVYSDNVDTTEVGFKVEFTAQENS